MLLYRRGALMQKFTFWLMDEELTVLEAKARKLKVPPQLLMRMALMKCGYIPKGNTLKTFKLC